MGIFIKRAGGNVLPSIYFFSHAFNTIFPYGSDNYLGVGKMNIAAIKPSQLVISTFRSGGKGGQHQNKTESGVRVRHIPSGIEVVCRDERSQYLNKKRALSILEERLKKRSERPKPRIATRISEKKKELRLEVKKRTGMKKQLRRTPVYDDS